jgi:uncharacterized protein YutD
MNKSIKQKRYIFIELYSKSLLKCLLIFNEKLSKKRMKSVLYELGNLLWSFYWLFTVNSPLIIMNIEYTVSIYFEYISQCINKFGKYLGNVRFENIAKMFCYQHILTKYDYCIKPFSYDNIQYKTFHIIKNRIDLYFFKHTDDLIKDSEYFAKFLIVLHNKYEIILKHYSPDELEVELDNLLNLVQDKLNSD